MAAIQLQLAGYDIEKLAQPEENEVLDALCDDLNTPNALTALYEQNKELNMVLRTRPIDFEKLSRSLSLVLDSADMLGIRIEVPHLSKEDKAIYQQYNEAKANKDFAKSDELRATLMEHGVF